MRLLEPICSKKKQNFKEKLVSLVFDLTTQQPCHESCHIVKESGSKKWIKTVPLTFASELTWCGLRNGLESTMNSRKVRIVIVPQIYFSQLADLQANPTKGNKVKEKGGRLGIGLTTSFCHDTQSEHSNRLGTFLWVFLFATLASNLADVHVSGGWIRIPDAKGQGNQLKTKLMKPKIQVWWPSYKSWNGSF